MPILTTEALGHAYGADELYHEVSLSVEARERVGLVGPNGIGKTTLLLNLAGLLEATSGAVVRQDGLTLGYLRQEAVLTFAGRDNTIYDEMLTVFAALREQEDQMRVLEALLATGNAAADVLADYGQLQEAYELSGGYQYQNQIKHVLLGLGFGREEWNMPVMHLSGGQKTRVLLGRLLLERPDLLILDEPTNHLDVGAVEWLEATLRRWEGALIIVSHDRYFLDRVATRIWELTPTTPGEPAELRSYKGNYTAFVSQRQDAWERAERLFAEEKERLERDAEYIQRHIAGGQTDSAKGRLRQLSRDLALIDQVGIIQMAEMRRNNQSWLSVGERTRGLSINEAIQQIRALRPPGQRPPRLSIRLAAADRSGRMVLRGKAIAIGYGPEPLFTADVIRLERGDRVALIGPNGSGKTTLLKTILNEVRPLSGEFDWGEGVQVGYFAQAHDQLNHDLTVLDQFLADRDMAISDARAYLAQYLFRGDDVFKPVSSLSGGERGRLALALLALDGANLLLLDEPTNHLDIPSQEVLQEVLEAYPGTILMVSHDRYLVDRLATQIWSIEDGALTIFPGSYAEYRRRFDPPEGEALLADLVEEAVSVAVFDEGMPVEPAAGLPEPEPRSRRLRPDERRRRQALQERIDDAEDWLARILETLAELEAEGNTARITEVEAERAVAEEELAALWDEMEELS